MDNKLMEVGERIKTLREILEISEEEMAQKTGVTVEEYRALEAGEVDFSFTFIYKCAQSFNVDIADLLRGSSPTLSSYSVVRKGEGMPIIRRAGFKYLNMAPLFKGKYAEPFYVTVPYSLEDENKEIKLSTHEGQEINIILKGSLKVCIDKNIETLSEGDTIYYNSTTPHGMVATGGADCEFISVVISPRKDTFEYDATSALETVKKTAERKYALCGAAERFISVSENENGTPTAIEFKNENEFNFAFDVVDYMAEKAPDKMAMMYVSNEKEERKFTFSDMSKYSSMTANYFKSMGIKKGDRVLLVLKRHYQFWFSILALHKIGAIAIPATNLLVKKDFEYRIQAAGVSAIVCTADGDVAHQVDLASPACETLKTKIIANGTRDGWSSFDSEIEKFSDVFERTEDSAKGDDPMLMFFTSGTTGYPKIATHSFKYALGHYLTARYWHNVNPDGLHFTISDTGWGKALWGKLYGQWLSEAAVMVYDFDKFEAADILTMFKKYNITTFCAPPTMYRFFIREDLSKYDLSSLEYATIAGEALNPEVYNQFLKATGLKLMEGFGQTETTLVIANYVGMEPKPGSMGRRGPLFDVDVVDPDGNSVKTGEVGEIVVKTDKEIPCGLFLEYYRDEEKTKEAWHDGMYHTGDTAWRDEDGYFWYVGRIDDLIKSSGYRIGPFEIESVIMELPYVLECAVTAAPDEIRGQVVKATIVLTKGTEATDELKKEIQTYVKTHTAPYKYPRIVEFVSELPKTISGKIRRTELRK